NLTWSTGSPYSPDGTVFTDFLYGLNGGTSPNGAATSGCFAGHCDWRLPIVEELAGIVDPTAGDCGSGSGACINAVFGPTQDDSYWSATSSPPSDAWTVDFSSGGVSASGKTNANYVRAVRGGL